MRCVALASVVVGWLVMGGCTYVEPAPASPGRTVAPAPPPSEPALEVQPAPRAC